MKDTLSVVNQMQADGVIGRYAIGGAVGATFSPRFMSDRMRKILESKQAMRRRLTVLPFSDKVRLLEQLRDRSLAIASSPLKRARVAVEKGARHAQPCAHHGSRRNCP